jgi:5-methylcytosine-specific restriction endonuclease McrA
MEQQSGKKPAMQHSSCGRNESRMFVDHIVERKDGGADYDLRNLQTLCGSHHTEKTLEERRKRGQASIAVR